jgi:uncharacterized protein (TIGR03382 family)
MQMIAQDGSQMTGSNIVTPELRIQAQPCYGAQLALSVQNFARDGSGMASTASSVYVTVDRKWDPVSQGVLTLGANTVTPEIIAGTTSVDNLNCIPERGGVAAHLRLKFLDGSTADEADVQSPGPWSFSINAVCRGASYLLEGELVGNPPTAPVRLDVPPVEVPLKVTDEPHLVVRCGQAASGTLEKILPQGPCSDLALTWERIDGPELTESAFSGQRIEVTTRETDFGALIGQTLLMRITADTGRVTQIDQPVPIIAEPFVAVDRRVENAVGTATDLVGVSVELRNTTECGVSQVDHEEFLDGADYVPGSARFNGTPVEGHMEGDSLVVRGLTLEANAMGRLTYVVRPSLFRALRFEGRSSVRGLSVSQPPAPPLTGCGCSGGNSGVAALGLAGLVTLLRRRRGR